MNRTQPTVTPSEGGIVDLVARVQAIGAKAREKARQPQQDNTASVSQEVKQLPLWPEAVRGVPNALLRSSLFTVNQTRETFSKRVLLASRADIELRFMGVRFNQTDLNVWEMLLHLARSQPLGNEVRFTAYSMLKELGRNTGKTQREQLKEEITRLRGGVVEITWKKDKKTFIGGLIEKAYRDEVTQQYVVVLDEKLLSLYESGYSHINWEQRKALKSNLAQWLHGMYSGDAAPYPYKVETIHDLCGSSTKELWKFRQMLKASLNELVAVGCIKEWEIDAADLVRVDAVPSSSQTKYINKKRMGCGRKPSSF
ncbi:MULTISPECIES: plasmid replication initiator TrfA [Alcaligenaceae]|uniref:plasmid replication initiator TrfA n=1 Tax=Alcaligenaceae TaxID=506 RepID=UPI0013007FED|nr:plasmid replication initiator TrfA [Bordetella bronchiseptica]